jgi:hypothetical protein
MRPRLKISQRSYPSQKEPVVEYQSPIANIEDEIMKNSSIAPNISDTKSAKENDEQNILDEPMVAKALELFAPKRVRVKRKS